MVSSAVLLASSPPAQAESDIILQDVASYGDVIALDDNTLLFGLATSSDLTGLAAIFERRGGIVAACW
jgi:hypothetical protein